MANPQFQLFLKHAPVAVAMFDRDMRYLAASRRWLSDYGLDEAVFGRSHYEVFPEIPERWKEVHRRALDGETISQREDRFQRLDGSVQWLEWEAQPWRDDDGDIGGVVLFTQDVTERRTAEEKLKEAQRRLEAVMTAVPMGVAYSDDRSCDRIAGNPAFLELFEMKPGDNVSASAPDDAVAGRKVRFLFEGAELAVVDLPMQRAAADERAIEPTELEIELASGRRVCAEISAAPIKSEGGETIGAVAVAIDLCERKRTEAALRESETRFRTLAEMSPDAILVNSEGRYVYANDAAARLLGAREPRDILGLTPFDIVAEPFHDLVRERYRRMLEENHTDPLMDYQWRRLDGSLVDVGVTMGPTLWRGGPALQVAARDIGERKRAEESLRDADRRKEEFLAMLAHELRNPLAPIRNGLYVARKRHGASQDDLALIAMMERQVEHLVRLVDDLIDISRINRGKIELQRKRVPLGDILRQAVETVQPHVEIGGHRLTLDMQEAPVLLDADPVRLAQVFANLLDNASKHSPPGGRILLKAEKQGNEAKVTVRDQGFGIAPDLLPHVFELFTQARRADRDRGGLGVGLALARRLVDLHDGVVEAFSEGEGRGAEFVVRLPLAAPGVPEADRTCFAACGRALRVLVVDDDRDVADKLVVLLESVGVQACAAYGGAEAIARLTEFLPHLIFLDIGMPGMDGFETARRIRELPQGRSPVLAALSGWGRDDDRRKTAQAGFDHHFVKPIDLASIERLLASTSADALPD